MIVSIAFFVLAALFTLLGVLKGRKYTWIFSALRIVCIVVTAILAMLFSAFLARYAASFLPSVIEKNLDGNAKGLLRDLPSMAFALKALIAMMVAPVLFWGVFPIVYNLLNLVVKLISRVLVKIVPEKVSGVGDPMYKKNGKLVRNAALRAKKPNVTGAILGGVCGFLLFCIAFVPIVGFVDTAYTVISVANDVNEEHVLPEQVEEVLDASVNHAGAVIVRTLGGKKLYDGLTTYREDGRVVSLNQELKLVGSVAGTLATYADENIARAEAAETIRNLKPALSEATLFPMVGAELCDAAAEDWLAGKPFHGIAMPTVGGYESLVETIVKTQKGATVDTFREDMGTLVDMLAHLVEKDAMGKIKGDAMALLGDRVLTEGLLYEILENPRLYVLVGSALDFGVDEISDNLHMHASRDTLYDDFCADLAAVERLPQGATDEQKQSVAKAYQAVLESYGIEAEDAEMYTFAAEASVEPNTDMAVWFAQMEVVSAETMSEKSQLVTSSELSVAPVIVQNKAEEAKLLADALATIATVSEHASNSSMDVADFISDFGPALDALSSTETVGRDQSSKIFKAVLQSKKLCDQIGLSVLEASEAADTINVNAHRSSYSVQLLSLSQTVKVIRSAGTEEGEAAIESLIQDLTPESASTLQTLSKPSVMINHGVPEKNAEPVSNMMSDMFGNLSNAKEEGMNEEQLQKETAAVNKVMTMGMNAGDSNGKAFGEGSVTGTSADQFVSDIMDSEVVSQTVIEQVYGDSDEPTNDPLKTERTMTAEEESELMAALNNHWSNASEEQKSDETYQKKLVSIAALVNITVSVGEGGVSRVAS